MLSEFAAETLSNQVVVCAVGYISLCSLRLQSFSRFARHFVMQICVIELMHVFSTFASVVLICKCSLNWKVK